MEQCWLNSKIFRSDYVVLYSDRSLSTAALRRLQEEKVKINQWPIPSVFSFPQLAKNILLSAKNNHKFEGQWPIVLEDHEKLKIFHNKDENISLYSKWQSYKKLNDLHKFNLSTQDLENLMRNIEANNTSEEVKNITQSLLNFYILSSHQDSTPGEIISEWEYIPIAVNVLEKNKNLKWNQILNLNPLNALEPTIWIPSHMELFPKEKLLLEALKKHIKIDFETNMDSVFSHEEVKKIIPNRKDYIDQNSTVFWAYTSEKPRPVETHELLSSEKVKIDIHLGDEDLRHHSIYPIIQWVDFHENNKSELHILARNQEIQNTLLKMGIDYKDSPNKKIALELIEKYWSEDFHKLETIEDIIDFKKIQNWNLLIDLGFFKSNQLSSSNNFLTNTDPEGVPVLALEDFPFFASKKSLIWSNQETLESLLHYDSIATLSKQLFNPILRKAIEAEGNSVSDPKREASNMVSYFKNWKEYVSFLKIENLKNKNISNLEKITSDLPIEKVSPTGLETYMNCPFRFYLDRLLRLPEQIPWDNPDLRAANLGTWVHKVLEEFFKKPDFENPRHLIDELLNKHLSSSFEKNHSSAFLKLVRRSGKIFLDPLTEHILQFEKPLRDLINFEKSLLEEKVSTNFKNYQLQGTVDRMDLSKDFILLFDYKTGRYGESSMSLIKKAKFQWFLYREIIKKELGKAVPAGGYINPLSPDKSRLFFFESEANNLGLLKEFFSQSSFNLEIITEEQEDLIKTQLNECLDKVFIGLNEKNFSPTPLLKQTCQYCSHKALCGRPYLVEELNL